MLLQSVQRAVFAGVPRRVMMHLKKFETHISCWYHNADTIRFPHNYEVLGQRVQGPSRILSRVIICSCETLKNDAQFSVSLLSRTQPRKEISGQSGVYA